MATPSFAPHPSFPRRDCSFLPSGVFWKMRIHRGTSAKFILVDGAGLTGASNNPGVVPNSDAVFTGKTGMEAKREVEIFGLTPGVAMIEFSPAGGSPTVWMQVEVVALSGSHRSLVSFSAPSAALNASDLLKTKYQLDWTQTISGGPPEKLFDSMPLGTKHVVLNCHGQMSSPTAGSPGHITLFIAGNITLGNCSAVFAPLRAKSGGGVIWIGGCEVGADNDFCKQVVLASNCFLVAPAITLPALKVPKGKIDWFGESMVKFFDMSSGEPMKASDFLIKQRDLGYRIIPA